MNKMVCKQNRENIECFYFKTGKLSNPAFYELDVEVHRQNGQILCNNRLVFSLLLSFQSLPSHLEANSGCITQLVVPCYVAISEANSGCITQLVVPCYVTISEANSGCITQLCCSLLCDYIRSKQWLYHTALLFLVYRPLLCISLQMCLATLHRPTEVT